MKVALVRGNCLNKWDMQYYPNLKEFNIYPTGICSEDNKFNISGIGMPIIKLKRFNLFIYSYHRVVKHCPGFFCLFIRKSQTFVSK